MDDRETAMFRALLSQKEARHLHRRTTHAMSNKRLSLAKEYQSYRADWSNYAVVHLAELLNLDHPRNPEQMETTR